MGLGRSSQHMSHRGVGVYRRSSQLEVSKHTCTPTHKPLQLCRLDRPFGRAREKKPHLFCQIRLSVLTAVRRSDLFFLLCCLSIFSQPALRKSILSLRAPASSPPLTFRKTFHRGDGFTLWSATRSWAPVLHPTCRSGQVDQASPASPGPDSMGAQPT